MIDGSPTKRTFSHQPQQQAPQVSHFTCKHIFHTFHVRLVGAAVMKSNISLAAKTFTLYRTARHPPSSVPYYSIHIRDIKVRFFLLDFYFTDLQPHNGVFFSDMIRVDLM